MGNGNTTQIGGERRDKRGKPKIHFGNELVTTKLRELTKGGVQGLTGDLEVIAREAGIQDLDARRHDRLRHDPGRLRPLRRRWGQPGTGYAVGEDPL